LAKPRLTAADRSLFVWLCRLFPSLRSAITIVQPGTMLRWHRSGFRLNWRWKSRSRGGRPRISIEVRSLIRRMSVENPLWGAPRIHGELLKLGIEVAQSTVAKYMARRRPEGRARPGRRSYAITRPALPRWTSWSCRQSTFDCVCAGDPAARTATDHLAERPIIRQRSGLPNRSLRPFRGRRHRAT
jgi:hypothetical protein